jgi:hypothetical protein
MYNAIRVLKDLAEEKTITEMMGFEVGPSEIDRLILRARRAIREIGLDKLEAIECGG